MKFHWPTAGITVGICLSIFVIFATVIYFMGGQQQKKVTFNDVSTYDIPKDQNLQSFTRADLKDEITKVKPGELSSMKYNRKNTQKNLKNSVRNTYDLRTNIKYANGTSVKRDRLDGKPGKKVSITLDRDASIAGANHRPTKWQSLWRSKPKKLPTFKSGTTVATERWNRDYPYAANQPTQEEINMALMRTFEDNMRLPPR